MIADSNQRLRANLVRLLDEAGYATLPCGTIKEVLYLSQAHTFDVAIIDTGLLNGRSEEAIQDLILDIKPTVPCIIATGYVDNDEEILTYENNLGINTFVKKPFNEEHILTALDSSMPDGQDHISCSFTPTFKDSTNRSINDPKTSDRIYNKLSAMNARQMKLAREMREVASQVDVLTKEECRQDENIDDTQESIQIALARIDDLETIGDQVSGVRSDLKSLRDAISESQSELDKSTRKLELLDQKSEQFSVNWDRVANIVFGILQTLVIWFLMQGVGSGP